MINKKIFIKAFFSFFLGFILINNTYALYELDDTTINKLVNNGYIISSKYNTEQLCNNSKLEYNNQISYYNRTNCFKNKSYYYYLKCDIGISCDLNKMININYSKPTTINTNTNSNNNNIFTPSYIFRTYNKYTNQYYLKTSTSKTSSQITNYNGETLYSTYFINRNYIEGTKALYISGLGVDGYLTYNNTVNFIGYIDQNYSDGMTRIYNCIKGNDHFISTDISCEGYIRYDNNVFYVYPDDTNILNKLINNTYNSSYNYSDNNYNNDNIYNTNNNYSNVYGTKLEKDINYKGNLKLNIQTTNINGKTPIYLEINSDLWSGQDRNYSFNANTSYMRENLLKNGIGYVSIDYSLSSNSSAGVYNVYYDIDCALQWIERNKIKYNIDTNNIYIGGIGAGGHLAMQYSLKQNSFRDNSCNSGVNTPQIKKVIGISGIYDLTTNLSNQYIDQRANNFLGIYDTSNRIKSQVAKDNSPLYSLINQGAKSKQYYIIYDKNDRYIDYDKNSVSLYNNMKTFGYDVKYDSNYSSNNGNNTYNNIINFLKPSVTIKSQPFNQYYYNCILYGNNCDSATNGELVAYNYVTQNNTQIIIANTLLAKQNINYCTLGTNKCVKLDNRWVEYYEPGSNKFSGYKITIIGVPPNTYEGYFKYIGSDGRTYKSNNQKSTVERTANGNLTITGTQSTKVRFSIPEYFNANYYFNYNGGTFKQIYEGWDIKISNGLKTYTQNFSGLFKGVYNSYVTYGDNKINLNTITIN